MDNFKRAKEGKKITFVNSITNKCCQLHNVMEFTNWNISIIIYFLTNSNLENLFCWPIMVMNANVSHINK